MAASKVTVNLSDAEKSESHRKVKLIADRMEKYIQTTPMLKVAVTSHPDYQIGAVAWIPREDVSSVELGALYFRRGNGDMISLMMPFVILREKKYDRLDFILLGAIESDQDMQAAYDEYLVAGARLGSDWSANMHRGRDEASQRLPIGAQFRAG